MTSTLRSNTNRTMKNVKLIVIVVVIEAGLLGLKIVRNVAPKYLTKAPNTKNSTKRHIDTNTGKMAEFPAKGSF